LDTFEETYVTPIDIVRRLQYMKRYWLFGPPSIGLEGVNGEFGTLIFDFKDRIVKFDIYIVDRNQILGAADYAIKEYDNLIKELYETS